jgi:hypothetical protein
MLCREGALREMCEKVSLPAKSAGGRTAPHLAVRFKVVYGMAPMPPSRKYRANCSPSEHVSQWASQL